MRTTVDIDDPLLARAKRLAVRTGRSLGEIVSAALGAYLTTPDAHVAEPFELIVRGRPDGRAPTPAELGAILDEEDAASLRLPQGRRAKRRRDAAA